MLNRSNPETRSDHNGVAPAVRRGATRRYRTWLEARLIAWRRLASENKKARIAADIEAAQPQLHSGL